MIDTDALRQINYVIEHDATSATYKYVLLKSVISICQKYEYLLEVDDYRVFIPLGLVIEQWVFDYMPFVFKKISQQHNGNILDKPIVNLYHEIFDCLGLSQEGYWEYAYMQFRSAYENPAKSYHLAKLFLKLSKKIATKVVTMPMKFIGENPYELFKPQMTCFGGIGLSKDQVMDTNYLVAHFECFSISRAHYDIYRYLGQTLYGTSTIITKWKDKTRALNREDVLHRDMIDKLSSDTLEIRDTADIRNILSDEKECVWSGKELKGNHYDVDHVLPFSVWFNNDLWNMLPTDRALNQKKKRAKIPSPKLIEKRADIIKSYWNHYEKYYPLLFQSQIQTSLTGKQSVSADESFNLAIESLCQKSHYLIYDRGHMKFEI
jgi:hypothetical protein